MTKTVNSDATKDPRNQSTDHQLHRLESPITTSGVWILSAGSLCLGQKGPLLSCLTGGIRHLFDWPDRPAPLRIVSLSSATSFLNGIAALPTLTPIFAFDDNFPERTKHGGLHMPMPVLIAPAAPLIVPCVWWRERRLYNRARHRSNLGYSTGKARQGKAGQGRARRYVQSWWSQSPWPSWWSQPSWPSWWSHPRCQSPRPDSRHPCPSHRPSSIVPLG